MKLGEEAAARIEARVKKQTMDTAPTIEANEQHAANTLKNIESLGNQRRP